MAVYSEKELYTLNEITSYELDRFLPKYEKIIKNLIKSYQANYNSINKVYILKNIFDFRYGIYGISMRELEEEKYIVKNGGFINGKFCPKEFNNKKEDFAVIFIKSILESIENTFKYQYISEEMLENFCLSTFMHENLHWKQINWMRIFGGIKFVKFIYAEEFKRSYENRIMEQESKEYQLFPILKYFSSKFDIDFDRYDDLYINDTFEEDFSEYIKKYKQLGNILNTNYDERLDFEMFDLHKYKKHFLPKDFKFKPSERVIISPEAAKKIDEECEKNIDGIRRMISEDNSKGFDYIMYHGMSEEEKRKNIEYAKKVMKEEFLEEQKRKNNIK